MEFMIHKIVAPIDFSKPSERAASYAAALARRMGATLHLVHVLNLPTLVRGPLEFYGGETPTFHERQYQDARSLLAGLAADLADGVGRISTEIRDGEVAESIVKAAVDYGADLVVMATHGRTGFSHLVMGSVAERVIRTTPCPVVVIRDCGQAHVHRPAGVESTEVV